VPASYPTACAWPQAGGAERRSALEQAAGAGRFRDAFLGCLQERRASLAAAAARALTGFLLNRAVDADLLDGAGARTPPTHFRMFISSFIPSFFRGGAGSGGSVMLGGAARPLRCPLQALAPGASIGCRQRERPRYAITCSSGTETMRTDHLIPRAAAKGPAALLRAHGCVSPSLQRRCGRAGLLPHRRKKNRELMEALTGPDSPTSPAARGAAPACAPAARDGLFADEAAAQRPRPGRCTRSSGARRGGACGVCGRLQGICRL